jgi:hypothetical protein
VRPGLEGEVGLDVEAGAKDDDGEEGRDIARHIPVLSLTRLLDGRRRPAEGVPLGDLIRLPTMGVS